jgi:hypothetical protein
MLWLLLAPERLAQEQVDLDLDIDLSNFKDSSQVRHSSRMVVGTTQNGDDVHEEAQCRSNGQALHRLWFRERAARLIELMFFILLRLDRERGSDVKGERWVMSRQSRHDWMLECGLGDELQHRRFGH